MATDLIQISSDQPDPEAIDRAAKILNRGGLVAIPTDALYSIVADPMNLHAVDRVFKAKGREPQRSLPLLVSDILMAEELAKELSTRFYLLARKFWPGPLTLIVPAASKVPLKVTGNTGRLAMRQSKSPVPGALLENLGRPLISTSANLSGQPTGRSGIDVFFMMDGAVDLVLDAGHCVGEGSTTVDVTEPYWKVIKTGAIEEKDMGIALRRLNPPIFCYHLFGACLRGT